MLLLGAEQRHRSDMSVGFTLSLCPLLQFVSRESPCVSARCVNCCSFVPQGGVIL